MQIANIRFSHDIRNYFAFFFTKDGFFRAVR